MCFFPRILESLPPLPRQHSAAIGCTKNYQPIGVTVHSHCVESSEGLSYSDLGEGGVAVYYKRKTIFPEHPEFSILMTCSIVFFRRFRYLFLTVNLCTGLLRHFPQCQCFKRFRSNSALIPELTFWDIKHKGGNPAHPRHNCL